MFLLRERKCIVSLPAVVVVGLKGGGEARGGLPFCNTLASMVKPESGGSASSLLLVGGGDSGGHVAIHSKM